LAVVFANHLPADRNVALLHNGGILSPYLSFLYQGVHDGDTVVIYPIPPENEETPLYQKPLLLIDTT
jgi:hypothetical protein